MRSWAALLLAGLAAVLVVAAVALYSLVAQKMYAKDKQLFKRHRKPVKGEETAGSPK